MHNHSKTIRLSVLTLAATCVLQMASAEAETVGKMTAVQTQVSKAGAGVMRIGSGVSMGDQLRSNATGLGMIVFRDESSAKLGPNSVLTIDEFVYGGGGGGSFGISMDRGVSRFYGGQVSKKGPDEDYHAACHSWCAGRHCRGEREQWPQRGHSSRGQADVYG
jgi:hypothetical protein